MSLVLRETSGFGKGNDFLGDCKCHNANPHDEKAEAGLPSTQSSNTPAGYGKELKAKDREMGSQRYVHTRVRGSHLSAWTQEQSTSEGSTDNGISRSSNREGRPGTRHSTEAP